MKTLIGMVAFVLEQYKLFIQDKITSEQFRNNVWNYANFLSRQPQLSDFVPCGSDGLPLEKPSEHLENRTLYYQELEAYQKALDKVLFKGFSIDYDEERSFLIYDNGKSSFEYWIVNDVLHIMDGMNISTDFEGISQHNLELTENAFKIIGV